MFDIYHWDALGELWWKGGDSDWLIDSFSSKLIGQPMLQA